MSSNRDSSAPSVARHHPWSQRPRGFWTQVRVMRSLVASWVLLASSAWAEASWLTARGQLANETRIEAFLGTRSFGAGFVRADSANPRAGISFEGIVGLSDRTAELRGARLWQLTERRFATASLSVGGAAFIVPDRSVDAGFGPNAQLALSLGGRVFSVDLTLQTGVELFVRQRGSPRFPQRAGLGLNLRVGEFSVSAMARIGADLFVDRFFVGRGEVMISVGWLGLDAALGRQRD